MIENKSIVITGASSGIGFETLKLLAAGKGNRILAVARRPENLKGFAANVIPFAADVSSREGIDAIFAEAEELFGKIDIFFANAGFPYYEAYDYTDWDRIERIFNTNTLSPIYTYAKYLEHLGDREGHLAMTISAMGQMAMPGYALYGATKFGLEGFQQGIRIEMPKNLTMTCLYPVSTATNFFKVAADGKKVDKPFPVQKPEVVAKKMVNALEKGKKSVFPCGLFVFAKLLMGHIPPVRKLYWGMERKKFERHLMKTQNKTLKIK
ncbi:MAG: SDR family NAD(P)-dependent oxidoreductase [Bacillota bacterium]|nr:SDR family NAD(P)-dependent oxidoreductase [Bacillota bacterium]